MPQVTRTDPDLWQRFETMSVHASVKITRAANGWEVVVVPRANPHAIQCNRADLLEAIVCILNEVERHGHGDLTQLDGPRHI